MPTAINKPIDEVLERILNASSESILVVDPSPKVIERLVDVTVDRSSPPEIRILAAEPVLKNAVDDFLVASNSADLVDAGVLSARTVDSRPGNQLFVTSSDLTALVAAGDTVAALSTDDESFVESVSNRYENAWNQATPYTLRTPPLSRVQETLEEEIGPDTADDFGAVLQSLKTARGDENGLDEVTISLLVAAKNEELLYDISKWGEDVGLASKATFSRTKTTLEDLGLIDTEKVPINVGRPRLRLKFGHEKLKGASADELASVAQGLMA